MKLHRFYVHEMHNRFGPIALGEVVWMHDDKMLNQWQKVLRFRVGDELVLFNDSEERLYKITVSEQGSVQLKMETELARIVPSKKVYLLWALLKKDKNDWVLQKATEIGVHKLIPIIADRSEKTGFNIERARKIIIEASEQCGRGDIPDIREPVFIDEAIAEYQDAPLFICEQQSKNGNNEQLARLDKCGLLIGPEGGWSDREKTLFENFDLPQVNLGKFTLRAETASVVGLARLLSE